jgi:hypothetical protein
MIACFREAIFDQLEGSLRMTLRNVLTLAATIAARTLLSSAVRVQISNAFGPQPLVVSDVHVARAVVNSDGSPTSSTVSGTDLAVTFNGSPTVSIPAGQTVASDSVAFSLSAESDVMVNMYFPQGVDTQQPGFSSRKKLKSSAPIVGSNSFTLCAPTRPLSAVRRLEDQIHCTVEIPMVG